MPIVMACPCCGHKVKSPDHLAGKLATCPKCQAIVKVASSEAVNPAPTGKSPQLFAHFAILESPSVSCSPAAEAAAQAEGFNAAPTVSNQATSDAALGGCAPCVASERWLLVRRVIKSFPLICGTVVLVLFLSCFGALTLMKPARGFDTRTADRLFASGREEEAVAMYRDAYDRVSDKARVLKRIVEFEVGHNPKEARRWIEKGLAENVDVAYDSTDAKRLQGKIKQERSAGNSSNKGDSEVGTKSGDRRANGANSSGNDSNSRANSPNSSGSSTTSSGGSTASRSGGLNSSGSSTTSNGSSATSGGVAQLPTAPLPPPQGTAPGPAKPLPLPPGAAPTSVKQVPIPAKPAPTPPGAAPPAKPAPTPK
jgi:hypothetical protein